MKKFKFRVFLLLIIALILVILPNIALAQDNTYVTLGITLGDPTGILGRWQINPNQGIEASLGFIMIKPLFSYDPNEDKYIDLVKLNLSVCYIFNMFLTRQWDLPLYLGVGLNFKFEGSGYTRIGVKGTVGIEKLFEYKAIKWSLFADFSIIMNFTPEKQGVIDWLVAVFENDPDTLDYFFEAFNLQFTIGFRIYIPT